MIERAERRDPGGPPAHREAPGAFGGLLLCGGASRRMGSDKAILALAPGDVPLLARADRALSAVAREILLASDRPEPYASLGRRSVADAFPGSGPIGGIVAGLEALGRFEWVLVLACDLPFVDGALLGSLAARARASAADVVMVAGAAGDEPLVAAYRPRVAHVLRRAASAQVFRLTPYRGPDAAEGGRPAALDAVAVERVPLSALDLRGVPRPQESAALLNVNDPSQLRRAADLAGGECAKALVPSR